MACRRIHLFEINIYNFTFITVFLGHKGVLINNEAILHSGQDSLQPKIELGQNINPCFLTASLSVLCSFIALSNLLFKLSFLKDYVWLKNKIVVPVLMYFATISDIP